MSGRKKIKRTKRVRRSKSKVKYIAALKKISSLVHCNDHMMAHLCAVNYAKAALDEK